MKIAKASIIMQLETGEHVQRVLAPHEINLVIPIVAALDDGPLKVVPCKGVAFASSVANSETQEGK